MLRHLPWSAGFTVDFVLLVKHTYAGMQDVLIVERFDVFDQTETFKFLSLVRDQLIRTQDKSLDLKLHLFQTWHNSAL